MKALALMLTRNEEHILPYTLPPLEKVCDHIIIADQQSDDATRTIIKKSKKTTLIDNPPSPPDGNYDTQGRQLLLDAARAFDGNNLLLCIDADEIAPPAVFHDIKEHVKRHHKPGAILRTRWVRLWKNAATYCPPWRGSCQAAMHSWLFYDDRHANYKEAYWVHSGRTPQHPTPIRSLPRRYALLHFHWLFRQRALWQQAWYQMCEFINVNFDRAQLKRINQFYHDPAITGQDVFTRRLPQKWRTGYQPPPLTPKDSNHWRKAEVMNFIKQHGIEIFEPLNIWYLSELKELFERTVKRAPQPMLMKNISIKSRQCLHAVTPPRHVLNRGYRLIKNSERQLRATRFYKTLKGKAS